MHSHVLTTNSSERSTTNISENNTVPFVEESLGEGWSFMCAVFSVQGKAAKGSGNHFALR